MQSSGNIFICIFLILISVLISYKEYKIENRIINVISIFSIGFLIPFSLSFLKLSKLSSEYDIRTIVLVLGSFLSFYIGVKLSNKYNVSKKDKSKNSIEISKTIKTKNKLYKNIISIIKILIENFNARNICLSIFALSFISFLIEVAVLRFIPLFSFGTPHAYSTFHIFGIHYITTLFFLMPAIAILNMDKEKNSQKGLLIFSLVYAVVMSLLLVSRSLLIMTVVVVGIAYLMRARKLTPTKDMSVKQNIFFVIALICFIGLYLSITVLRSHSVDYLNDIFEMKENTPIFITQPYMYLTQGFENLNYLVTHNERFTFGRRTLAPLFSLLRTKKYFPLVTEAPFYQIKLELTSKPIIYDLYYDFSMIGTFILMFIMGYIVKKIEIKNYKENNIYYNLFFCIVCYYLLFSFFQSYLSLLDTWFYLIFTYILYIISTLKKAKK